MNRSSQPVCRHLVTILVLSCLVNPAWPARALAEDRPNLILIMADDLGHEALGCYGGRSYSTPLLDQLASRGMRFTHCYSQPVCTPSRVKIMTGQSNARNYREFGLLPAGQITFGHLLKAEGYRTCIAGKWQLSGNANSRSKGMTWEDCGFDQSCMWAYSHYLSDADRAHWTRHSIFKGRRNTSRFWNPSLLVNGQYQPTTGNDFGPDLYTQFILDFIQANRESPFFIYYPMALTHSPFVPTPHSQPLKEEDKIGSNPKFFGDMIRYTGHLVNRIIKTLGETGIAEKTLVLVTTDNGTGRGIRSHLGDRLVLGGKALPIDAGCHVPLIAYWKGTIRPGSLCHNLVEFSDFLPTLMDAAGGKAPAHLPIDGQSFLPQLLGRPTQPRPHVLVHYDKDPASRKPKFRRVRFAYDGQYKLYQDGRFFHVPSDWDEERPRSIQSLNPNELEIRQNLQAAFSRLPAWNPDNSIFGGRPDDETTKRLAWRDRILGKAPAE